MMRWRLAALWAAGAALVVMILPRIPSLATIPLLVFLSLACAASIAPSTRTVKSSISFGWAVGYACALLWGAAASAVAGLGMALTISLYPARSRPKKLLFNVVSHMLVGWSMGSVVEISAVLPGAVGLLLRYLLAPATYFLGVSLLAATATAPLVLRSPFRMWREHAAWQFIPFLPLIPVGVVLARAQQTVGLVGVVAVAIPLCLASYTIQLYLEKRREIQEHGRSLDLAQHRIELQLQELGEFRETVLAMNRSLSLTETLRLYLDTCCNAASCSWSEVRVVDEQLRVITQVTKGPSSLGPGKEMDQYATAVLMGSESRVVHLWAGDWLWMLPLTAHGNTVGMLLVRCDRNQLERAESTLRTFSAVASMAIENACLHEKTNMAVTTDELTGLHRYPLFLNLLDETMNESSTADCLLMTKIDELRLVNNGLGFDAGDWLIHSTANLIKSGLKAQEFAARCSAGKFLVLLRGRTRIEMERWVDAVLESAQSYQYGEVKLRTSLSVGAAFLPAGENKAATWIAHAEEAMSNSRRMGIGRLIIYDDILNTSAAGRPKEIRKEAVTPRPDEISWKLSQALLSMVEAKDPHSGRHSERVRELAASLARFIGLPIAEVEAIELAALLHDIGKIAIPNELLKTPMHLTDIDFAQVKEQPRVVVDILKKLGHFDQIIPLVAANHERVDGLGYPDGLKGPAIPLGARIIRIADAFDAMTTHQEYREARSPAEALAELSRNAGTQFDPFLVAAFIRMQSLRDSGSTEHSASPLREVT